MSTLTLHRARWVLPVARPPIPDGAILVEESGGTTAVGEVGPYGELAGGTGAVVDHGEAVLMPALVNAHTHLELAGLRDRVPPGLDFAHWLERIAVLLPALGGEESRAAIEAAIVECVAAGTGLVGDVSDTGRSVEPLVRSGLRARVFHQVLAFDPRRAEATFAGARARLLELAAASGPGVRHALAPHAPYSVSARLLRLVRGFNGQEGRPTSIHLAESAAEEEFFSTGGGALAELKQALGTTVDGWEPPGQPSVVYLARLGWFESPGLVVHCTQLSARGIEILRQAPITVCLCPRSNRALGVGVAPARALAAAGVPLALGTDSPASAPSLSLFDELAAAHADYGLDPERLVEAATRGGARALGFAGELGELGPGRPVAAIAVVAPAGVRLGADPYALLLGRPGPESIRWVAGPVPAEARLG
jgi:cytosine/adenosine deaminase-related metal-dependent hydrolase